MPGITAALVDIGCVISIVFVVQQKKI